MYSLSVKLENNEGFSWLTEKGLSFKGYIFEDETYISGREAAAIIRAMINDSDDIAVTLKNLNGVFAFVYEGAKQTLLCCDRTRTFPLFYAYNDGILAVSDDAGKLKSAVTDIDDEALRLFLYSGYVPGSKTLLEGISQVQAGEFVTVSKKGIKQKFYHKFELKEVKDGESYLKSLLTDLFERTGKRLAFSLEGKVPVLPLSSGYDSRLIACLLKMNGFENVITYTYGRKGNFESDISRKTAEMLGYEWINVEYNNETVKDFLRSEDFRTYYHKSANFTSMFFLQEFFAVKFLKDKLPENAVFIPGHSGDSIAGSHIKDKMLNVFNLDELTGFILRSHFIYRKIENNDMIFLRECIKRLTDDKDYFDHQDYQNWILKERHGKFIVNSSRIYEFFNFEFRMPLVDKEFIDFFETVHPSLKCGKKLYDDVLKEQFFKPFGLNFKNETNQIYT